MSGWLLGVDDCVAEKSDRKRTFVTCKAGFRGCIV